MIQYQCINAWYCFLRNDTADRLSVGSTEAVFILFNYAFHILPQFWQTHLEICFDDSFCLFGAKIFANNARPKKQHHFVGIHHHPMQHHQRQPRCLFLSCVSVTTCTLTFWLPHFGQVILSFLSSSCILRPLSERHLTIHSNFLPTTRFGMKYIV